MDNVVIRAELGKWAPKLRSAIRFYFSRKPHIAKPTKKNLADSVSGRGSKTSYPRITTEAIHYNEIMDGFEFKQVGRDLLHGESGRIRRDCLERKRW